jgi:hypothetical protein
MLQYMFTEGTLKHLRAVVDQVNALPLRNSDLIAEARNLGYAREDFSCLKIETWGTRSFWDGQMCGHPPGV